MKIILISIFGFWTVFLSVISIERWFTRGKRQVWTRMKNVQDMNNLQTAIEEEKEKASFDLFQQMMTLLGKILEQRGIIKPLEAKMLKADIPLRGEEYLFFWLLFTLVPGTVVILATGQILAGLLLGLIGFILPPLLVSRAQHKKVKKFNVQLIDALSIIANSLRAGYSFMQSMELVSREMPNPIGKEFARAFREINLGTTTEEALNNLGQRIASDDLELIITAVLIQRQTGGNLAEILDNISHTIRERIRIQGEIRTLTAQGKISGLVVGLIPIFLACFISLINPEYLVPLFHSTLGLVMLIGGIVSEVLGVLIIRKIIAVDI